MRKVSLGKNAFVYPMPMTLVGVKADDKANFLAVGWVSRVNASPPMITVALGRHHYTNPFITKSKAFSINVPGTGLLEKTDYCGLVSGGKADKSAMFDVFYGELKTAPMIRECPVNMECQLVRTVELPTNDLFIGEIVAAYADEVCMTDGKPDIRKISPFTLTMPDNSYWAVGPQAGKAWNDGKKLMR